MFFAGAGALAAIFLIVLINGQWPFFLKPVQHLFAALSSYVGDWAFPIEGLIFVGPGLVLIKAAEALQKDWPLARIK